jgi:predicted transposase YbfD/YdcC
MATKHLTPALIEYFADLPDPRIDRCKAHQLDEIIVIAILAVICGAEHFTEMEAFGEATEDWLKTFLKLEHSIPSHDTFARVFALLSPAAFNERFVKWMQAVRSATADEVVAIDGKTMRRSADKGNGHTAIHLVSAWATRNRLTLGQIKVAEKSNEITAVPELLRLLNLKGCIVTMDALNPQKEIVHEIREQGADYLLALKDNHPHLRAEVEGIFEAVRRQPQADRSVSRAQTNEQGHGRTEVRRSWSVAAPNWLTGYDQWRDLNSLVLIESTRTIKDQTTTELRYFISSLPPDAARSMEAARSHWGIENSLHWVLDVVFREDDSRVRIKNAAENLALVRKITHNLLEQEKTLKRGIKTKRLMASWDRDYLLKIIGLIPTDS